MWLVICANTITYTVVFLYIADILREIEKNKFVKPTPIQVIAVFVACDRILCIQVYLFNSLVPRPPRFFAEGRKGPGINCMRSITLFSVIHYISCSRPCHETSIISN